MSEFLDREERMHDRGSRDWAAMREQWLRTQLAEGTLTVENDCVVTDWDVRPVPITTLRRWYPALAFPKNSA
jgi:hypothetical protein